MQSTHEHGNFAAYRQGEFFKQLSPAALADLEKSIFPTSHPAHSVLFAEGHRATGIVIVLEGEVRLSINSQDGAGSASASPRPAKRWGFPPRSRVTLTR